MCVVVFWLSSLCENVGEGNWLMILDFVTTNFIVVEFFYSFIFDSKLSKQYFLLSSFVFFLPTLLSFCACWVAYVWTFFWVLFGGWEKWGHEENIMKDWKLTLVDFILFHFNFFFFRTKRLENARFWFPFPFHFTFLSFSTAKQSSSIFFFQLFFFSKKLGMW